MTPGDPITLLKYFTSIEPILYVIPVVESYRTGYNIPRRLCFSRPTLYHRSKKPPYNFVFILSGG